VASSAAFAAVERVLCIKTGHQMMQYSPILYENAVLRNILENHYIYVVVLSPYKFCICTLVLNDPIVMMDGI